MSRTTTAGTLPAGSALAASPFTDYRHCVSARVPLSTPDSARWWADRVFADPPTALRGLMLLRDRGARAVGLRPVVAAPADPAKAESVGPFPVLQSSRREVVFGVDDSHLDFRGSVYLQDAADHRLIWVGVVVQTHGWTGQAYLLGVRPAHPLLAAGLLRRAVRTVAAEETR